MGNLPLPSADPNMVHYYKRCKIPFGHKRLQIGQAVTNDLANPILFSNGKIPVTNCRRLWALLLKLTVSQKLKIRINEGQRTKYIYFYAIQCDESLQRKKSKIYRPVLEKDRQLCFYVKIKAKLTVSKSWTSNVVSILFVCLFQWMPISKILIFSKTGLQILVFFLCNDLSHYKA